MQRRKFLSVLACGCAVALCGSMLVGCGSAAEETEEAVESEYGEGFTLIVGFDAEYPPYGFIDDAGDYTGFDLDLAAEVAERNGWSVEYVAIDWDTKDAQLESGAINCIWNGFTYEGREDSYAWSDLYMINAQVVVVPVDSAIASIEDLEGCTVMTQADSAALEVLTEEYAELNASLAGGEVQQLGDYNSIFMQLQQGSIDAVACDLSIALYQQAANPDAYVILDTYLSEENYAVGFLKGNDELASIVSATLLEMYADGTVESICADYEDYGLSFENWILTD